MTSTFRRHRPDDADDLIRLRELSFASGVTAAPAATDEYHVLASEHAVDAALRVHRTAQWFGGRCVPTAGVASVMVSPERRGQRLGSTLLTQTLDLLRRDGVALSTLYPSTPSPYRRLGYEIAGARVRYRHAVAALPVDMPLTVEAWTGDRSALEAVHASAASSSNGALARDADEWSAVLTGPGARGRRPHTFVVHGETGPRGYATFTSEPARGGDLPFQWVPDDTPYNHVVSCRDLVWLDGDAARALLGFFAQTRATATDLLWTGPVGDPLLALLPSATPTPLQSSAWMLRLVDVPSALAARGYPRSVDAFIDLEVVDPVLSANTVSLRLEVGAGVATVDTRRRASCAVDVATLAAMYSGWLHPVDAARLGGLRGATTAELDVLAGMFGGPSPWMLDLF